MDPFVITGLIAVGGAIGATVMHILESSRNRKSERRILQIMTDNMNYAIEKLNNDNENLAAENNRLLSENKDLKFKLKNKVT